MLKPSDLKPWAKIATGDRTQNARAVRALVERVRHLDQRKPDTKQSAYFDASRGPGFIHCRFFLSEALQVLLRRKLPLEGTDLVDIGAMMASAIHGIATRGNPLEEWLRVYDNFASGNDVDDRLGAVVRTLADALSKETYPKETVVLASEYLKRARSISPEATSASGAGKYTKIKLSLLEPSEVGSSTTLLELKMGLGILPKRELVLEPIGPDHAMLPADCPLKEEHELISRLMSDVVGTRQYSEPDLSAHASSVIGLCAASCYRKIPGVGPRAVKVANACVYSLSQIGNETAVGQLAVLKVRVKFGTAQKEIEKALNAAAAKLGLPRDQIEEMGVPAYGLEEVGRREETFGQYRAEICANGPSDVAVRWFDETGNALKSVPAKVKAEFKDELKELQQAAKDIAAMLPAQRDRIDSLFLAQKQWTVEQWRQRYIDHPLVGVIGRKLIWQFEEKGKKPVVGIYVGSALRTDSPARAKAVREADPAKAEVGSGTDSINRAKAVRSADPTGDGIFVDSSGKEIQIPQSATVQLWHPIGKPIDEILRWRSFLEQKQIVQPFKQAHREVYLLTDAERNTRTYSNPYAAHILRQHQFNALAAARGWKNKLRMMVDDVYPPPTKELPAWGLRAEFWIEGIGDNYGVDTTDAGAYLRVSTDQVRFYRTDATQNLAHAAGGGYSARWANVPPAEPLPLEDIPPLVFSEIMRDVDLFVGVASVGNDPTWADGGLEGRYRDYWQNYSFGNLTETAKTRRDVLSRLLPRLRIAGRCELQDRFLLVRGDLRTYKIHLGSGNILMEPNDQYLCIVPARGQAAGDSSGAIFLPFEGDSVLSIILSKAFMLAEDTKIKDSSITRQIRG